LSLYNEGVCICDEQQAPLFFLFGLRMAPIKIPERYESGLLDILSLSDEVTEKLISVLQDAPPKILPSAVSEGVFSKLESIPIDDLTRIIETLLSLYYTKNHHDKEPDEMAEDVCKAVDENTVEDFDSFLKQRDKFKARLTNLLSIQSLDIASKGFTILKSNENGFHDSRIITEIRPIFGSDPEIAPTAAVILHMLNITYHREGEMKELYFALDTDDLDILREAIDRADLKAKSLKALLDKTNITNVTLD